MSESLIYWGEFRGGHISTVEYNFILNLWCKVDIILMLSTTQDSQQSRIRNMPNGTSSVAQLQTFRQLYQQAQETINQLRETERTLRKQLKNYQDEIQSLKEENQELQEEVKMKSSRLAETEAELNSLKLNSSKSIERKDSNIAAGRMNANSNGVPTVFMDLSGKSSNRSSTQPNRNTKYDPKSTGLESIGGSSPNMMVKSYELMKSQNQLLERTVKNLNQEMKRMRKQEEDLRQEIEQLDDKNWSLKNSALKNAPTEEIKSQIQVIEELRDQITDLRDARKHLQQKVAAKDQEIKNLIYEREMNGNEHDNVKSIKGSENSHPKNIDLRKRSSEAVSQSHEHVQNSKQQLYPFDKHQTKTAGQKFFGKVNSHGVPTVYFDQKNRKKNEGSNFDGEGPDSQDQSIPQHPQTPRSKRSSKLDKPQKMRKISQLVDENERLRLMEGALNLKLEEKNKQLRQLAKKEDQLSELQWNYDLLKADWERKSAELTGARIAKMKQMCIQTENTISDEFKLQVKSQIKSGSKPNSFEQKNESKPSVNITAQSPQKKSGFKYNSNGVPTVFVDTKGKGVSKNLEAEIDFLNGRIKTMGKEIGRLTNTQADLRKQLDEQHEQNSGLKKDKLEFDELRAQHLILQEDSKKKIDDLNKKVLGNAVCSDQSTSQIQQSSQDKKTRYPGLQNNKMFGKVNSNGVPTVYVDTKDSKPIFKNEVKNEVPYQNVTQAPRTETDKSLVEKTLEKRIFEQALKLKEKDQQIAHLKEQLKQFDERGQEHQKEIANLKTTVKNSRSDMNRISQELSDEKRKFAAVAFETTAKQVQKPIFKGVGYQVQARTFGKLNSNGVPTVVVDTSNRQSSFSSSTPQQSENTNKQVQELQKNVRNLTQELKSVKMMQEQLRRENDEMDAKIITLNKKSKEIQGLESEISQLKQELEKAQKELERVNSELARVKQELEASQHQIESPPGFGKQMTFNHKHQDAENDKKVLNYSADQKGALENDEGTFKIKMKIKLVPKEAD